MRWLMPALGLTISLIQICIAGPRDQLWQQVYEARAKGLPRTAISYLEQIIPAAISDQAWAEATKAVCLKVVYESQIEGNKPEERIARLQPLIETVPEPMRPCMEVVLGHWYVQYFSANRWRFLQRTATAQPPGQDITTWDLATILKEVDRHYTAALSAQAFLKATPIQAFDDLIEKGTVPDSYRPTLYDFVVFEVLGFYSAGEMEVVRPQDAYDLPADSPIFDPVEQFLACQPEAIDQESVTIKAIRLYQSLLQFHKDDPDPTAFIDADLHRLQFGYNRAVGPEKTERYIAALQVFADRWAWHEISAMAIYYWASAVNAQGDPLSAYQIAQQAITSFPESIGGQLCHNLIQDITAKSLSIKTEWTWTSLPAQIQVQYKNLTSVHFRLVPFKVELKSDRPYDLWYLDKDQLKALLDQQPVRAWSSTLPQTADFKGRIISLPAPSGLGPGFYYLIASSAPDFREDDNVVSYTPVCVTDLAVVIRRGDSKFECLVVGADTGAPVVGAKVSTWQWDWGIGGWLRGGIGQTDANGLAQIQWEVLTAATYGNWVVVEHNGRCLISRWPHPDPSSADHGRRIEKTLLFTDRAIYRPGQTIMYKGICVKAYQDVADYKTLAGIHLSVGLYDANGQIVATQEHVTNDYGSFSGSFTAPEDRLPGVMYISVQSGPSGNTSIRIEEYKRPTFMVQLEQPQDLPRLGHALSVTGRAVAYTGAAIDAAQVRWRVERRTRLPFWCWYIPYPIAQAIAYGSALTRADGSFSIDFEAKPDLSIPESSQPVFEFIIYVDVTDSAGETRCKSITIPIGYTTIEAEIQVGQWLTADRPVGLTIVTRSVAGLPESASGLLRVYRLRQPDAVVRPSLFSQTQEDQSDPNTWDLAEQVYEGPLQTDGAGRCTVHVQLPTGSFRAVLSSQDPYGKPITAMLTFHVIDPDWEHFPIKVPFFVAAPAWTLEPGQEFICLWGTGYQTGQAFVEIECNGKVLQSGWTRPDRTQQLIRQPVTEQARGGFTLRITFVRQNRAYLFQRVVDVPWTNKQLSIRWEHFRSLLEPGQHQSWSLVIKGPDALGAVAEVLAGMYDASLEQFVKHAWTNLSSLMRREQVSMISTFDNVAVSLLWGLGDWDRDYWPVALSYRQFVDDIEAYIHWPGGIISVARGDGGTGGAEKTTSTAQASTNTETLDLSQYTTRKDLSETAFFYPHLISDKEGLVRIEFTMPEALTQWRFMALAHDRQLRSGYITDTVVTAKDLMVQPNPPRFVREGDQIEFTVRVFNQSPTRQTGQVMLSLSDAWTGQPVDASVGNTSPVQSFDTPSGGSQAFGWRLTIPDGCGVLVYKVIAASDRLSDGQEAYLPVLSRRVLVIESLPISVRGPQTKHVDLPSLLNSGQSDTLRHQSLTVQVTSQPAWYAMMALPYLMETPTYCIYQ
ncbi:MAG: alpha-2-macroglobulin family protein, partial [Sedimentisphaerales bacterium]|nr:alpha-2-macroglobulin family protein [Sedimentisphaerales bacterium]